MARTIILLGAMAAALASVTPASAQQVLDAVYRGTLVCDKLPFTEAKMREAIDVTITGGAAKYSHIVRLKQEAKSKAEQGEGAVKGRDISLQGTWDGGARQYKASYSGSFIRRSARLKGTQTWTIDGKTVTRQCSGVIKRPLKAFLPRKKKPNS